RTPQDPSEIQNRGPSIGLTVLSGLTGCAVAFVTMLFLPPILFVALIYRIFGWSYTFHDISGMNLAVASGGMLAIGAILGIVVGRRLRTQPVSPQASNCEEENASVRTPVERKRGQLRLAVVWGSIVCLGALFVWAIAPKKPPIHETFLGTQPGEERIFAGITFCWCPPGSFTMGSPESEAERKNNEGPQHTVTFKQGFWMSKYEITHGQWKSVDGFDPSHFTYFKGSDNLPVEMVSWHDCRMFLEDLNEKDGGPFRLPSEAEWEYACRAGTQTPFFFGETLSRDQANYIGQDADGNYGPKPTDAGSFPGNAWNLCDMHGSVSEWCQDGWHEDYTGAPTDGSVYEAPEGQNRVFRGGNWDGDAGDCRSASRQNAIPGQHDFDIGFRIVRTP
ncbi:MAG: hypothetical protein QG656_1124, partial [Candidatus Hydrogenedentes bacterium]|nr:hypothetical protein [Candidatus Hydrogenedentota bacterium]